MTTWDHLLPKYFSSKTLDRDLLALGAVFTGKCIIRHLKADGPFIWAGITSAFNETRCMQVARVVYTLKIDLKKLRNYVLQGPGVLAFIKFR